MSVVHVSPLTPLDVGPGGPVDPDLTAEAVPHTWRLSGVEFEDGVTTRCFECVACDAVRYS